MTAPTMDGFTWTDPGFHDSHMEANGWCLRDSVCQLFRWAPGSPDWNKFVENPSGVDAHRLFDYLGLTGFNPSGPHPEDWEDHPGVALYVMDDVRRSHVMYQPHVRRPLPIPRQYRPHNPEYVWVAVDLRQPPH